MSKDGETIQHLIRASMGEIKSDLVVTRRAADQRLQRRGAGRHGDGRERRAGSATWDPAPSTPAARRPV